MEKKNNISINVEKGSIKFRNYFKKLTVPFKIHANFESVLKRFESNDKDRKKIFIDDKFSKPVVLYRGKK